jgi:uncharacterized protein YhhL (DUF1145 family)
MALVALVVMGVLELHHPYLAHLYHTLAAVAVVVAVLVHQLAALVVVEMARKAAQPQQAELLTLAAVVEAHKQSFHLMAAQVLSSFLTPCLEA